MGISALKTIFATPCRSNFRMSAKLNAPSNLQKKDLLTKYGINAYDDEKDDSVQVVMLNIRLLQNIVAA